MKGERRLGMDERAPENYRMTWEVGRIENLMLDFRFWNETLSLC